MPLIRRVEIDRPWLWLAKGWADMLAAPRISIAYGALIAAISVAIVAALFLMDMPYFTLPMAAGFFLVAPLVAVGLYETSRRLEAGEPVTLAAALAAILRNRAQLANLGIVLMLINLAWVRIATLLFALFFQGAHPTWGSIIDTIFFSPVSIPFLATGTVVGLCLAVCAFSLGAVSIPMLLDRDVNVFVAVMTSISAVRHNWRPMALWAALIVVFTAAGMATFFIGLAVVMPLIGHATWHAYRDVVLTTP
ncbi:MAG: DUF2189 domain-containing protein [Alphaproteobacteria bacterium]|nr:DUF2189 domain-containing protein [Alphaproteobacteria bacterium]